MKNNRGKNEYSENEIRTNTSLPTKEEEPWNVILSLNSFKSATKETGRKKNGF